MNFVYIAQYCMRKISIIRAYYVIEVPEGDSMRAAKKPLRVYWNVPTMQCKSKKVPFENLFEKYGILQNKNDSFRGEKISILYDPGLFPAILKNDSSGTLKFRNGGVPQGGDLEEHLSSFRQELDKSIPNPDFSGLGIIDFESWRPVFRQNFGVLVPYKDTSYEIERKLHWWWPEQSKNFGVLVPYKDTSYEIERKLHWWWPEQWIKAEAKRRFEASAREFMQTTLSVAKQMRPNALWGYYAFPYCFNMAKNGLHEACADGVPNENDKLHWLWSESSALFPSIYSSRDLSTSQLAALVRGRMSEATRVSRRNSPVLPYFWFRYREGGYLSEVDLKSVLHTLYSSGATGFVIWGSSNDVNTKEKCNNLQNYLDKTLGPNIAKYTKANTIFRDEEYNVDDDLKDNSTTTENNSNVIELDPDFYWEPPKNYTYNIKENVEEEIRKKNTTLDNKISTDDTQHESVLISKIINSVNNNTNVIVEDQKENQINTDTSQSTAYLSKNSKKGYPITDHGIEGFVYTTRGPYLNDKSTSTAIAATSDYFSISLNTSTKVTHSSKFIDIESNITTEATTFRTESPNFDTSTDEKKTQANLDLVTKAESSKWLQETTETATESVTESVSESIQNYTAEYIKTVPIEDVTDSEVTNIHFFNHDTFLKDFNNIETTETSLDQTTDYKDSTNEFKDSSITKDFRDNKSTSTDLYTTDSTDCIDCTESSLKTDTDSLNSEESLEDSQSTVPNQVIGIVIRNIECCKYCVVIKCILFLLKNIIFKSLLVCF
ncbi:hypothetical protein K1T71_012418 [Dendrolimus kikuchii]|uniref:Uncharacterized protein n=1 Tax=Dendrolimus kikuchii TaxID=765133 RepID=A0ACC1CJF7_9NEOP|nr:hypothetical protein K1T71_012418 [Dendrolimus kikuchii]